MSRRKPVPVARMDLVGGAACLNFVNTTGARATEAPRERLRSYPDLLVWSRRTALLSRAAEGRLRRRGERQPSAARRALGRAVRVRETLYAVLRAAAEGREPPGEAMARLSEWWRAERTRQELVPEDGGFVLRPRVRREELDAMLWPIVASAVELLTSGRLARLRRCAECDWLFLDQSKNGSRTWCRKSCGDRVRARRYYRRSREGLSAGP
jgi:predicted RNA-binding Zn ribbon-like protein